MPTRHYLGNEVGSLVSGFTAGPSGNVPPSISGGTEFGLVSLFGTGQDAIVGGPTFGVSAVFTYTQTGVIDFTLPLGIPVNAQITRIVKRTPCSVSFVGTATPVAENIQTVQVHMIALLIAIQGLDQGQGLRQLSLSDSKSGVAADQIFFDNEDAPLTRAQLISGGYGNQSATLTCQQCSAGTFGVNTITYSIALNSGWQLSITYVLPPFSWTITSPSGPYRSGDIITVTSTDGGLGAVSGVRLDYGGTIIEAPILTRTEDELTFVIPDLGSFSGDAIVYIVGDGVEVVGTFNVGSITILFADASGIYKLTLGKRSDTLYVHDDPATTIEVPIPSPFIKTGFIGN